MTAALSSFSGGRTARQHQNQFHRNRRPSSGRIENDKTTSPRRSVVVQNAKTSPTSSSLVSSSSNDEKEEELWLALG
jgi:hypothetical protein